ELAERRPLKPAAEVPVELEPLDERALRVRRVADEPHREAAGALARADLRERLPAGERRPVAEREAPQPDVVDPPAGERHAWVADVAEREQDRLSAVRGQVVRGCRPGREWTASRPAREAGEAAAGERRRARIGGARREGAGQALPASPAVRRHLDEREVEAGERS